MFAEAGDERSQIADLVTRVETALQREAEDVRDSPATVRLPDEEARSCTSSPSTQLCELIDDRLDGDALDVGRLRGRGHRRGVPAAARRRPVPLRPPDPRCGRCRPRRSTGSTGSRSRSRSSTSTTCTTGPSGSSSASSSSGCSSRRKRPGPREPLVFLVLDELNKYAPREGWSPIKEVLLDVSERGRSLGIILIGAQQTASEVERRDRRERRDPRRRPARPGRGATAEYGFLTDTARQRAALLKPGTMLLAAAAPPDSARGRRSRSRPGRRESARRSRLPARATRSDAFDR